MTREETHTQINLIISSYPTAFRYMKQEVKEQMEEMMFNEFKNLPLEVMEKPIFEAIRKNKNNPPTIETIKDELKRLVFYLRFQINQTADIISDQTEEEKNEVNRLCREIGGVVPEDEEPQPKDYRKIATMESIVELVVNYFREKGETNV